MSKKNGFTLIELIAVLVLLAILAVILTPIVTNAIVASKKSANERSVEGHIDDIQFTIASKVYKGEIKEFNAYDVYYGELSTSLHPTKDTVHCEKYTIREGIVLRAVGCRVAGSEEVYDYDKEEGTISEEEDNKCDGCVYAIGRILSPSDGMDTRPKQALYLKYPLYGDTLDSNNVSLCIYSKESGEYCFFRSGIYTDEQSKKEEEDLKNYFGYDETWEYYTGKQEQSNGKLYPYDAYSSPAHDGRTVQYSYYSDKKEDGYSFHIFGYNLSINKSGPSLGLFENSAKFYCGWYGNSLSCEYF